MGKHTHPKRTIYLDMDGVLVNFTLSAMKLYVDNQAVIAHMMETWPNGKRVHDIVGVHKDMFWRKVNEKGVMFWSSMIQYPWCSQLVTLAQRFARVVILSSPARGGESAMGKIQWIEKNLNELSREFILTPKKHKCRLAKPGDVLIDDTAETCSSWTNHGGDAILFPRPWNNHPDWCNPMQAVIRQLGALGMV